jgi:hypothetical protein
VGDPRLLFTLAGGKFHQCEHDEGKNENDGDAAEKNNPVGPQDEPCPYATRGRML